MMTVAQTDAKSRILDVAAVLFSERGLEGTSIRELARLANVNLAAINYYFQSKENLYLEVIKQTMARFRQDIAQLFSQQTWDTESFMLAFFDMLIAHGPTLMNNFKVLLSNFPMPEDLVVSDHVPGPPGAEHLLALLERDLQGTIDPDRALWAVSLLFTYVVHTALMASTPFGQRHCSAVFGREKVNERILLTVQSVKNSLKATH